MQPPNWTPIESPPNQTDAVELRFDDGSTDLALWTGSTWLPEFNDRHPTTWRPLPVRFPLLDEFDPTPRSSPHAA